MLDMLSCSADGFWTSSTSSVPAGMRRGLCRRWARRRLQFACWGALRCATLESSTAHVYSKQPLQLTLAPADPPAAQEELPQFANPGGPPFLDGVIYGYDAEEGSAVNNINRGGVISNGHFTCGSCVLAGRPARLLAAWPGAVSQPQVGRCLAAAGAAWSMPTLQHVSAVSLACTFPCISPSCRRYSKYLDSGPLTQLGGCRPAAVFGAMAGSSVLSRRAHDWAIVMSPAGWYLSWECVDPQNNPGGCTRPAQRQRWAAVSLLAQAAGPRLMLNCMLLLQARIVPLLM